MFAQSVMLEVAGELIGVVLRETFKEVESGVAGC
jgi:hypothetical protein